MTYTSAQATAALRSLGFRIRTSGELKQTILTFQGGYNLGTWLKVDGICGPLTSAAIARSISNGRRASAHFTWREFACTCRGTYAGCKVILVRRELLQSLEKYRTYVGPVKIVSGYRCPLRNKAVGGASSSQHLYGTGADVPYVLSASTVIGMRVFAGIGRSASSGKVRHVDRRDVSGHNNGGSVSRPVQWTYSS